MQKFTLKNFCLGLAVFAVVGGHWSAARAEEIFDNDASEQFKYQDNGKHWAEQAGGLPAFPKDADLVPVAGPTTATLKLYIDKHSITVGSDQVVRLTYILESPSGVRNIFYEGYHCSAERYKTYAYGMPDGKFQKATNSGWRPIPNIEINNFRKLLDKDVLCTRYDSPRNKKEILSRIAALNE